MMPGMVAHDTTAQEVMEENYKFEGQLGLHKESLSLKASKTKQPNKTKGCIALDSYQQSLRVPVLPLARSTKHDAKLLGL